MGKKILLRTATILVILYFLFVGLSQARVFLIPLAYGILLAIVLYPMCLQLEKWGVKRVIASLISTLLILFLILGVGYMLSRHVANLVNDLEKVENTISQSITGIEEFVETHTGIPPSQQEQRIKSKISSSLSRMISVFFTSTLSLMASITLVLSYTFFFLLTRSRFQRFISMLVPPEQEEKASFVISRAGKVAGSYLFGKLILIMILSIIYAIGFFIIGIPQAIITAIIVGLFSLIPYVGNIVGGILAIFIAYTGDGGLNSIIGVLVVMSIAQVIENNILQPFIVGSKVNINPAFSIVIVVLGGITWGISGTILAIPFLGILKVVFDNVSPMEPFGYLVGTDDGDDKKLTKWIKKKINKVTD